jgi:iron complex transport system ATP-binding protein
MVKTKVIDVNSIPRVKYEEALHLDELSAHYALHTPISLKIKSSQIVGIIAANGVGKSTLLKLILGIEQAHTGFVRFYNQAILDLSAMDRAKALSYMPQRSKYAAHWSTYELIQQGQLPHISAHNKEVYFPQHQAYQDIIDHLHLNELQNRLLCTMSGGEKQRAFLARTLIQNSNVLLLDEPLAHLDWHIKDELMFFLKTFTIQYKKLCLIAMHDLNLAALYCDKILLLYPTNHKRRLSTGPVDQSISYNNFEYGSPNSVLTSENLARAFSGQALLIKHPQNKIIQRLPRIIGPA